MPRKTVCSQNFNPPADATHQDIINALGDKSLADIVGELEDSTHELKRASRALELILDEEVEV